MTTFTWSINGLLVQNTDGLTEVAVMSNFTILGVEGDISGQVNYSVNLLPPDAANFTPYADITEAQAIAWTQAALGPERVAAMEQEVQTSIDQQKIPTPQPAPLPWTQPPIEPEV
jgi:hypothetical protein